MDSRTQSPPPFYRYSNGQDASRLPDPRSMLCSCCVCRRNCLGFFWNNMVFHGGSGRKLASTSLMHGVRDASASQKLTPGERTQACLLDPTIVLRTQLPPKRSPGQWTQEGLYCSPPVVRHAGLSQLYCVRGIYYHVVYCYILSQCSQGL